MGSQGQSGQAIKLFQITSYVNDFQTLNNLGYRQPVGASKKIVLPSIYVTLLIFWLLIDVCLLLLHVSFIFDCLVYIFFIILYYVYDFYNK